MYEELCGCKILFVAQSKGAVLICYYLTQYKVQNHEHIVMLSPPNNGSEIIDKFRVTLIFKWITCLAGVQLGTDVIDHPKILFSPGHETGITAGDRSMNPFLSLMISGKNDEKVSEKGQNLQE